MSVSKEKLAEQFLKGRRVKIYEDPLTRKVFEGYATIISVQSYDEHEWWMSWDGTIRKGMARCGVQFEEDEYKTPHGRRVSITDNEEEEKASTSRDLAAKEKAQKEFPATLDYSPESYKFEAESGGDISSPSTRKLLDDLGGAMGRFMKDKGVTLD